MRSNSSPRDPLSRDRRRGRSRDELDEPILEELLSIERLEQDARTLASIQRVTGGPRKGRAIQPRVAENGRVLLDSYRYLVSAIKDDRAITPAAEWLVDNYPIVDEQLREIHDDLPSGYYRELPKLTEGHLAGYPRVVGLAWAYIAHTDSRFDPEILRRMVHAYQEVAPLTIGELWAIAISVRILLVDNLRRISERIVHSMTARQMADELADSLLGLGKDTPEAAAALLRRRSHAALPVAGRVQLYQRLRDQDPALTPALRWLEEFVEAQGTTAEAMVRLEHQRQVTINVTVRNVITSMRQVSWFDWAQFVESLSMVDVVLRAESAFGDMDFATRDRYRDAIEELARGSGRSEVEVTRIATETAAATPLADDVDPSVAARRHEPGYYLISDGRAELERLLGVRVRVSSRLRRAFVRSAATRYVLTFALVTGLLLCIPLVLYANGRAPTFGTLAVAVLALGPASDLAIALLNRLVTEALGPKPLPGLDLDDGVPTSLRTLVVVPMLLTTEADVEAHVGDLEVHYLGNREGDLRFALLSDWLDSPTENAPGDNELLATAEAAIDRLNERHGEAPEGGARFLLFHRKRAWNPVEGCWMGWERKRGKLHELNALLRGSTTTGILTTGRTASTPPPGVRYVVTLDADTRLPRGAVGDLVGTIAHPLNQPTFDPLVGRVTEGYGVLQPRITATLPSEHRGSLFQRIYSGSAGIDPYASAVSDVYQDLFEEGSFTGKGIYDVDAFIAAMANRVPENTLLSHDLFEGVFARAALVTDVEFFDEHPSNYLVAASRQHRWARGDWQLLPWILGRAKDATGERRRSSVRGIARWKMIDNLRRTVSAPLALATLVAAWTIPSASAGLWTAAVAVSVIAPAALPVAAGLLPQRHGVSRRSHLRAVGGDIALAAAHAGLAFTFLAYQAWLMVDAVVRTLTRMYVTRRHLLEWVTAAQATATRKLGLAGFYRHMAGAIVVAVATAALVFALKPSAAWIAVPFVILWLLSPLVARWISLPPPEQAADQLSAAEVEALRLTARRTWLFFETFVGSEDNALPPDNFQDDPRPVVEHRTSPTNIGMYLLATVTARDFGWIGTHEMVERLEATLETIGRLERFRGHLYNWYDTRDLHRLDPQYVSSVDSGNLAGHLLTLSIACRQMIDEPLPVAAARAGIADAFALTRAAAAAVSHDRSGQTVTRRHLDEALEQAAEATEVPATLEAWAAGLHGLSEHTRTLSDVAEAMSAERDEGAESELVTWAEAARLAVSSHVRDLALFDAAPRPDAQATAFPTISELCESPASATNGDGTRAAVLLVRRLHAIADQAYELFTEMDFSFLFDPTRKLFSIGYKVRDGELDPSCYDLLASEARLASFLAIAKGDVAPDHWFRLGRALTPVGRGSALVSWSGSMFEYLMPALVMRAPANSLLDQTNRLVVARQMRYAAELDVPWGISESGFNARDLGQTYQYSSFGVPGLGLKRGLGDDLVVAPYATALAAMIEPKEAVRNFARLNKAGASGRYGFREALDYTERRLPEAASVAIVSSYMAHHQGMALVSLGNVLNDRTMVERFHADPMVEATELLLQERMPRNVVVSRPRSDEVTSNADVRDLVPPILRRFNSPHDVIPRTHVLSNGRYAVMVTAAGSGYSRWHDMAVTRWREDVTCDSWGSYLYVRDMYTGDVRSAGHQPTGTEADRYEVIFSEDHAEFSRRDGSIVTGLNIVVSAEHDAEIRRVSLTNLSSHEREIELTSYAEIVLAPQAADVAHPAFQKLFVQTEFVPGIGALLATRRPRSSDEEPIWAAHVAAVEGQTGGVVQYETDRARFIGRGRTGRSPASVVDGHPLSNTVGAVLDPIFSLRRRVTIAPGATAHAIFSTVVAPSREEVLDLADRYRESATYERAAVLAWTHAQVQLHHLGIKQDEAHLFQRLANRVLYSDPSLRPSSTVLAGNDRGAPGLWAHGMSGDLPIVMVRIDESTDLGIVRQLMRAHEYWRLKLLDVDLVILNEHGASYVQDLQDSLENLVRMSPSAHDGRPGHGGVYLLRGDQVSESDRTLLQTAARAVVLSREGSLADQVIRLERPERIAPPAAPPKSIKSRDEAVTPRPELEFFNGLGGFADGGREYVTILGPGQSTPAPWLNVIANSSFGFQVSESGSGYTWSGNSRENQLTPWSNDPVSDPVSEAIYVRDDDSGELWCPTALPIRCADSTYVARHGAGYSRFEHLHDGIHLDLIQFVAHEPLKISVLTVENRSGRPRRLSVTAYAEWALGTSRGISGPRIVTALDHDTQAILVRNPWNIDFAGRVVFFDLGGRQMAWTADRTEFVGRNGDAAHPSGLDRGRELRGASGAGLDPCAALQTSFELAAGARTQIRVLLGEAEDAADAARLVRRGRMADHEAILHAVANYWDDIQGNVQVRTPDRSMDIMLNRWLIYQTLACRLWARSAFYQAGGAFGFRDQLQDVVALVTARREIAREHLLRAAAQQFIEGDVQHWWHPPSGRGVRTQISDDRIWLPYAVDRYLAVTGDTAVLDEIVPYLEGPALQPDEMDLFFMPERSSQSESLFDHCARALERSLAVGVHGLPLMGSGDWNDGMNRVGQEGRGESIWLGWFLHIALAAFVPIAEARGEAALAERWRTHMDALREALERDGWDGDWYRRAYFDDGTPLGSAMNAECRIDSIAQSWSVLSGVADPSRAQRAMAAVEEYLVRRGDGLVLLFTPPFDRSDVDPGYIKGYLPGIRENGGQYTHGAIWSVLAFAALGDGDKAGDLFSILNPINHASTRAGVHRYKVEPYVMAADVYTEHPHVGRGGWTWYTGSSGWMYQAGIESILGFRLRGTTLLIDPCIPRAWPGYEIDFRYHTARYLIVVENPQQVSRGVASAELDGQALTGEGAAIPLFDDGATHRVRVVLGWASPAQTTVETPVATRTAESAIEAPAFDAPRRAGSG